VLRPKIDVKGVAGSDAPATRQNYKAGTGAGYRATRAKALKADMKGTGSNFQQSDPDPVTTMENNVAKKMRAKVEYRDPSMKGNLNAEQMKNLVGAKKYVKANPSANGKSRVVVNRRGDVSTHGYGQRTDSRAYKRKMKGV
jgi:hypothetical protein